MTDSVREQASKKDEALARTCTLDTDRLCLFGGGARVSEGGVFVRKECRIVESEGSQRLTGDRGSGGLGVAEGTPSNVLEPFFHAIRIIGSYFVGPPRVAQRENAQRNVTRRPDSSHACLSSLALRPPSVSQ